MTGKTADDAAAVGWADLLRPEWIPSLIVLLGGVLLYSMNVMLLATVLPSIVGDVGGAALMSWPTTAYLASSIIAATCTGLLTGWIGPGRTFLAGALIFCAGSLMCAVAPSMGVVIGGRFVQGLGGGLLSAMSYVLVRQVFPQAVWPRAFAALAGIWGVSVLVGPLVGGSFAQYGDWRDAFYAVAALAAALGVVGLRALPGGRRPEAVQTTTVPVLRVGLICLAIAAMSLAAVTTQTAGKAGLIVLTLAALVLMLLLDRRSPSPLLPRDAFSLTTVTGVALWVALLLSFSFNPLSIFGPLFLQLLHGFEPLAAGYAIAGASMAWTMAAMAVAGLTDAWPDRMIVLGSAAMAVGLLGFAVLMPAGPVLPLLIVIVLVGAGIGSAWAFTAQSVMGAARSGEEDIAASSVATVQQAGLAIGAALSGLIANAVGFSARVEPAGVALAAFWVPVFFVASAALAVAMAIHLALLKRRTG